MSSKNHDLLATRLAAILRKLNYGEQVSIHELAAEFNVSTRTIQRDLLERLSFLQLEKDGNDYRLHADCLGRIKLGDITRFASLAGLNGMFPGLDSQFIREWFDNRIEHSFQVHDNQYEDLRYRMVDFRTIQQAIQQQRCLSFQYQKPEGKKQVEAEPYKLINHAGIWYLAACDQGQIKAYSFSKMSTLNLTAQQFKTDNQISSMLEAEDSIWLNSNKTEVVLSVSSDVASYFRRRNLIAQQEIIKELADGSLMLSGKFAHQNQLFPVVRAWLPHVRILNPASWQSALEQQLREYLGSPPAAQR